MAVTQAIVPLEDAAPKPVHLAKRLKPKAMTVEEAKRAAKSVGLLTISVNRIKGFGALGDYLTQIGVLSYGRAVLAFSVEQGLMALLKCDQLETKLTLPEQQLALVKAREAFNGQIIKAGKEITESAKIDASGGSNLVPQARSFTPGQPAFPVSATKVEVNVGVAKSMPTDE